MIKVHSIETFGTNDGPGIRLVVFVQGCIYRCLYCHNPDTWQNEGGKPMETDEIIQLLENEKPYFKNGGGLTISGGEPLVQRTGLLDVFTQAKAIGIHTALDTAGSIFDDDTKKLLEVTDLVILDVKHIDPEWHKKVTGQDNAIVLQVAEYCEQKGNKMWLRYVLVPGLTDQPDYLHQWGKKFQQYRTVEKVEILQFHHLGFFKYENLGITNPLKDTASPSKEITQNTYDIFSQYFPNVVIR